MPFNTKLLYTTLLVLSFSSVKGADDPYNYNYLFNDYKDTPDYKDVIDHLNRWNNTPHETNRLYNSPRNTPGKLPPFAGFAKLKKTADGMQVSPEWIEEGEGAKLVFYEQGDLSLLIISSLLACLLIGYVVYAYFDSKKINFILDRDGIFLPSTRHPSALGIDNISWKEIKGIKYFSLLNEWGVTVHLLSGEKVSIQRGIDGTSSSEAVAKLGALIEAYHQAHLRTTKGGKWRIVYDTPLDELGDFDTKEEKIKVYNKSPLKKMKEVLIATAIFLSVIGYLIYWQTNLLYINKVPICIMDGKGITDHRTDNKDFIPWGDMEYQIQETITWRSSEGTTQSVEAGFKCKGNKKLLFSSNDIPSIFFYQEVQQKIREEISPLTG
ncbi:MAG: hypothetical protein AAF335_01360 [Bacteroidota bacterium]